MRDGMNMMAGMGMLANRGEKPAAKIDGASMECPACGAKLKVEKAEAEAPAGPTQPVPAPESTAGVEKYL